MTSEAGCSVGIDIPLKRIDPFIHTSRRLHSISSWSAVTATLLRILRTIFAVTIGLVAVTTDIHPLDRAIGK